MRNEKDEGALTPVEAELADALGRLSPAAPDIDLSRMMFRAGRLSARRRGRMWQAASIVLAASLAASLTWRAGPQESAPTDTTSIADARPVMPAINITIPVAPVDSSYVLLRDKVLSGDLDALDAVATRTRWQGTLTVEQLLGVPSKADRPASSYERLLKLLSLGEQL